MRHLEGIHGNEARQLRVGILVLNWNRKEDTVACFDSLYNGECESQCLLAVDNGSADGSVDALLSWSEAHGWPAHVVHEAISGRDSPIPFDGRELFVLRLDENRGYTGGNNAGFKWLLNAGADAVLILNNDTWVSPGAVRRMAETLEQREDAGIVGCQVVDYDSDAVLYQGGNLNYWLGVHFLRRFKGSPSGVVEVNFVPGCAMLVRASVLRSIGGFREDLFLYTDDIEFCHRVRHSGWKILANLDAVIRAKIGASTGGPKSPLYYYFVTRNTLVFIQEELRGVQRLVALTTFTLARAVQIVLWLWGKRFDRIYGVMRGFFDFVRGIRGPGWAAHQLQVPASTNVHAPRSPKNERPTPL